MNTSAPVISLADFFDKLTAFEQSESHATFLSIGGRGYYENPASDLLQFFLQPENAHGLGKIFIEAFLEVAQFAGQPVVEGSLVVRRESETRERKRIDLVIEAPEWVLLIENKIWHHQANPFEQYEELATTIARGRQTHFAILSPSGHSTRDNWTGVSYEQYLAAIDSRLAQCSAALKASKWFHFAQDFTLHLSQELYHRAMTTEELAFVEENHLQLAEAAKLQQRYREHLMHNLPEFMNQVGNTEGSFYKDDGWCIRLKHPKWGNSNIAWFNSSEDDFRIKMTVYVESPTQKQLEQAQQAFGDEAAMEYWTEAGSRWRCWRTRESYETSKGAEAVLAQLLGKVFGIFGEHNKRSTTPGSDS